MPYLIFIDTNIYLDYYRSDRSDVSITLLDKIYQNRDRIITTSEVEMEYKKNRQREIIGSMGLIKTKDTGSIKIPPLFKTPQLERSIKAAERNLSRIAEELKERTSKLLESPELNDPVYKVLEKLFRSDDECHLNRDKIVRFTIRRLAKKRFMLGYPPRKDSDLSLVDAINWEWIIYCAKQSTNNVIIVSRDGDYGPSNTINDWLLQEYKERVSSDRIVELTNSLTYAFKLASIKVSRKEEQIEKTFLTKKSIEDTALQEAIRDSLVNSDIANYFFSDRFRNVARLNAIEKSFKDYLDKLRSPSEDSSDT